MVFGLCQNLISELLYLSVKNNAFVLLALMLFATGSSTAMSLGRYRGAALVGRPLDISVQAVLSAQDDPAALCIEADAFYADNKLDKSLVRVSTEKALSNPLDTLIRIRSSVPVDEPVVTLNIRVGCQQKTERRYVILADLASEPSSVPLQPSDAGSSSSAEPLATRGSMPAATSAATLPTTSPNSILTSPSARQAVSAPARRNTARTVTARAVESSGASDAVTAAQEIASTSSKKDMSVAKRDKLQASNAGISGQVTAGKARLKLEPLDLSIERDPELKPSKELLSVPSAGEQRLAAAALWRALGAQPQDLIKDAEKIQSLENSLGTLRTHTQKDQLALNELNSQLEKARSQRYDTWLIYVLGLLLILALAGLVYLWRLRTLPDDTSLPWWRKNKLFDKGWTRSFPDSDFPVSPDLAPAEDNSSPTPENKKKKNAQSTPALPNSKWTLVAGESALTEARQISRLDSNFQHSSLSPLDFTVSLRQVARSIKAEELFDVQQQADFFVSLGQHEQAVDVLRGHIASNSHTSPLVYMDLFDLYHQLDRQTDYEALRTNFNQLFTGNIPEFGLYALSSTGLEAYPVAMARIVALWPSPKVIEVIEESILRKPVASSETFDLEAYRELLLLYAIAREIVQVEDSKDFDVLRFDCPGLQELPDLPDTSPAERAARISGFSLTSIQPLSASTGLNTTQDSDMLLPPQSPRLALDVNLDDLLIRTTNTPLPDVGMKSNSNSNSKFFARLGTKMPVGSPARSPAPIAPHIHPPEVDNLINFDDLDAFIQNLDPAGTPKDQAH